MRCVRCGQELTPGLTQCPSCGKRFDAPVPIPQVAATLPVPPKPAATKPTPAPVIVGWVIVGVLALIFWPVTLIAAATFAGYRFSRQNRPLIAALSGGGTFGVLMICLAVSAMHPAPPAARSAPRGVPQVFGVRRASAIAHTPPRPPDWSKIPDVKQAPLEPIKASHADIERGVQAAMTPAPVDTVPPVASYSGGYGAYTHRTRYYDGRRNHHRK